MKNTTKNILLAGLLCLVSSPVYSATLATPADMARLRDMLASIEACKDAQNPTNEAPAIMVNTPEAAVIDTDTQELPAEKPELVDAAVIDAEEPELVDAAVIDKDTKSFLQKAKAKLLATKQAASAKVGAWYSGACDLADDTTVAIHYRSAAVATSLVGVAVTGKNKLCSLANATGRGIATAGSSARRVLTSKPAKIAYGVTAAALVAYIARVMYTVGDPEMQIRVNCLSLNDNGCNGNINASALASMTLNTYWTKVQEVIAADQSACATAFKSLPGEARNLVIAAANGVVQGASAIKTNALDPALQGISTGLGSAWDSVRNLTSGLSLRGGHNAGFPTTDTSGFMTDSPSASATPSPLTRGDILQSCLDSVKSQVPGFNTRQCVVDYDAKTKGFRMTDLGINSTVDCLEEHSYSRHSCSLNG